MRDDEIVNELKRLQPTLGPLEMALHLDTLLPKALSMAHLVFYFKRAFPTLPLRVLMDCASWRRLQDGPVGSKEEECDDCLNDAEFERLLSPYWRR